MIETPTSAQWELEQAMMEGDVRGIRGLRSQATELLWRLQRNRAISEQRAAENGQRDPIKAVTGRSALDAAIAATRGMIERMDELIIELDHDVTEAAGDARPEAECCVLELGSRP